jgi:hypothetical protein
MKEEEERKREEEERGPKASWWVSHAIWIGVTESRHIRRHDSDHVTGTVPWWSLVTSVQMTRLLYESRQSN